MGYKHFKFSEFACKCGCGENKISHEFVKKLDACREEAGVPFLITSGYRCVKHNKKVGGVADSSHTRGYAADIAFGRNMTVILGACRKHFKRVGVYKNKNFVHVDIDPDKTDAVWQQ